MSTKKFEIDSNIYFSIWSLDSPYCEFKPELSLDYVNESPDHWYSDQEKSIDISVQQAKEIIEFLQSYVNEVEK